jgi:hypothetical protein
MEIPHRNNRNEDRNDPEEAISWKRANDPSLVEDKLLTRNVRHFGQAQSPVM